MICLRCQRTLRSGEGLKCGVCESRYHFKCVGESNKNYREGGDPGYEWKCAVCQRSVSKEIHVDRNSKEYHDILKALNSIDDKIEVVNKYQLPKFYSDLAYVKTVAERVTNQNKDILRRITEIDSKIQSVEADRLARYSGHQSRSKNLLAKPNNTEDISDRHRVRSSAKNRIWYRSQRRPYLLHRVLRMLNDRKPTCRRCRK